MKKLCLVIMVFLMTLSSSVFALADVKPIDVKAANGELKSAAVYASGQWIQDAATGRWWYRHSDGSYTTNNWEFINGEWYYFDSEGWMVTGELVLNGNTFRFSSNGDLYYTKLGVNWYYQQGQYWCWAACAEMVGKYKNPSSSATQSSIVTFIHGTPGDGPEFTGWDPDCAKAITYVCGLPAYGDNATRLSFSDSVDKLMNYKPFVSHILWNSGGRHDITCYGYDEHMESLFFLDPGANPSNYNYEVTYSILLTGCNLPTGSGRYNSTVYLN